MISYAERLFSRIRQTVSNLPGSLWIVLLWHHFLADLPKPAHFVELSSISLIRTVGCRNQLTDMVQNVTQYTPPAFMMEVPPACGQNFTLAWNTCASVVKLWRYNMLVGLAMPLASGIFV